MATGRCYACMRELPGQGAHCPHCGKLNRELAARQKNYALSCGTLLHNRYVIGCVLGQGGFGMTYIGFDQVLQTRVCIKEYYPSGYAFRNTSASKSVYWRGGIRAEKIKTGQVSFLNEARKAAKLRSFRSVVKVWDAFYENETAYIVMDYVEGVALKEYLDSRPESPDFAGLVELLDPVLADLDEIHKLGIVHRDISPDNIMVQPNGEAMLLDLGAAKDLSNSDNEQSMRVAKKGFSPPEQYLDHGVIGPWTDVYAICATLYYCLTGKTPPSPLESDAGASLDLRMFRPAAAAVLRKGMAMDYTKRYQSVGELRRALQKSCRGHWFSRVVTRYKLACIASVLAVACLCGAGGLWLSMNRTENTSVTVLGTTNANVRNYGGWLRVDKQVEYYIAGNNALYRCPYDAEDETFYLNDAELVCDFASYLTRDEDTLYFFAVYDDGTSYICCMDLDGGNLRYLRKWETPVEFKSLQYAALSDGSRYLYYLFQPDAERSDYALCRYDLSARRGETIVAENVVWFNLYENTLYYITRNPDRWEYTLLGAGLNGQHSRILNTRENFSDGIVEDGVMLLYSRRAETILVCDLEGRELESESNFDRLNVDFTKAWGYGDGWVYYSGKNDGAIRCARVNGTGDELVLADHTAVQICTDDTLLWLIENRPTERRQQIATQMFITWKDGGKLLTIQEPGLGWIGLESANRQDFDIADADDGGVMITGYHGRLRSFKIPGSFNGRPVTEIAANAFNGSGIERIGLPDSIRLIGDSAFYNCKSLYFVGLPAGLEGIGISAFGDCRKLESIELTPQLREIGSLCFAQTGLTEVYIPEGVSTIGVGAFAMYAGGQLREIRVSPDNTSFITVDGVLYRKESTGETTLLCYPSGREEESFTIGDSVTAIAAYAFAHTKSLRDLRIPDSVVSIEKNAFFQSGLTAITVSRDCRVSDTLGASVDVQYR